MGGGESFRGKCSDTHVSCQLGCSCLVTWLLAVMMLFTSGNLPALTKFSLTGLLFTAKLKKFNIANPKWWNKYFYTVFVEMV